MIDEDDVDVIDNPPPVVGDDIEVMEIMTDIPLKEKIFGDNDE